MPTAAREAQPGAALDTGQQQELSPHPGTASVTDTGTWCCQQPGGGSPGPRSDCVLPGELSMEIPMIHAVRWHLPSVGLPVPVPRKGQHSGAAVDWGAAGRLAPPPLPDPAMGQGQFLSVPGAPAGLGKHYVTVPAEPGGTGDG